MTLTYLRNGETYEEYLPCLLVLIGLSTQANAQRGDWEVLGSKKVNFGLDRDVFDVGIGEGVFTRLKIGVRSGSLNMHKMVVVYGNGERDEIPLRHNFNGRSTSRVIDLEGNRRVIKEVIFWYDSDNDNARRATLVLAGKK